MAYTKQTWAVGDTISAQKLNNIENGIEEAANSGGAFYVTFTTIGSGNTYSCNKTPTEIKAAIDAGKIIIGLYDDGTFNHGGNGYYMMALNSYYYVDNNNFSFEFNFTYIYYSLYLATLYYSSTNGITYSEHIIWAEAQ